jgi:hypothetical protein
MLLLLTLSDFIFLAASSIHTPFALWRLALAGIVKINLLAVQNYLLGNIKTNYTHCWFKRPPRCLRRWLAPRTFRVLP